MNKVKSLNVVMDSAVRIKWNYVLQKGFYKIGTMGMTVREFMNNVLGYDDQLIELSVRTIFLNYSPVDNIDATRIQDADKLSLGSAMPGVVGIVMGRDNPYKSFRSDISSHEVDVEQSETSARVFIKIFSNLAVDTGTEILARGIEVDASVLADFMSQYKDHVVSGVERDATGFPVLPTGGETVRIVVRFVEV